MDSSCLLTFHIQGVLRNHDSLFWADFLCYLKPELGESLFSVTLFIWHAFLSVTDGARPRPGELGVEGG